MKTQIVEALGETVLALPGLVTRGLQANDRAKYYMSLLQACRQWATTSGGTAPDLSAERQACGDQDEALDRVIAGTRATPDGVMFVPHAGRIVERLFDSVDQMLAPFRVAPAEIESSDAYEHRLGALRYRFVITDDTVPAGFLDAVTHANRRAGDSVHLLVMDLHRELNRAQCRTSEGTLDGAAVYGLSAADEPLVRAFMLSQSTCAAPSCAPRAIRCSPQRLIPTGAWSPPTSLHESGGFQRNRGDETRLTKSI